MDFSFINFIPIWPTIIAFVFFTALLLLMLIYSRVHWVFKTIVSVSSLGVFLLQFISITNSFGWPYEHTLPAKFFINWVIVNTPTNTFDGNIQYWVRDINIDNSRLYQVPYTEERHKQAEEVLQQLMDGQTVIGQSNEGGQAGQGDEGQGENEGKSGNGTDSNGSGTETYDEDASNDMYDFEVTPETDLLPPKVVEEENLPSAGPII